MIDQAQSRVYASNRHSSTQIVANKHIYRPWMFANYRRDVVTKYQSWEPRRAPIKATRPVKDVKVEPNPLQSKMSQIEQGKETL